VERDQRWKLPDEPTNSGSAGQVRAGEDWRLRQAQSQRKIAAERDQRWKLPDEPTSGSAGQARAGASQSSAEVSKGRKRADEVKLWVRTEY
jgi:hypothetical protein